METLIRLCLRSSFPRLMAAVIAAGLWLGASRPVCGDSILAHVFQAPPDSARPWVYWFWLNGNITREGITADLEAMKRVGIGGVLIMEVDQGAPLGPVSFVSPQWRELFKHVVAEAGRLGLEVNMNNDAGWEGSGGPWIKPEQSMQKVVWSETKVDGPKHFEAALQQPQAVANFYRDITVLAFPEVGSFRIDNIDFKACYKVGPSAPATSKILPAEMVIDRDRIIDLTARMDKTGRLAWDVPPGKWTIVRFGHTSTGVTNAPSPASGQGLECDKLSKEGIEANFAGLMAKLVADAGPAVGKALVATHIDSWENGAQNWTSRMRDEFQKRRGYDLLPYLPTMTGCVVGSLEVSERFLWDLRQTISDLVVENYAGHLRTLANQHGLRLSIEAYGGPCDDLPYAGRADESMCEFWIGSFMYSICKEMASAAHTYGKTILGAEAFTATDAEKWRESPGSIKSLGDQAFCAGVNRFVFHRYAMQPWLDRKPGMTMGPWGIHYERTNTWWNDSTAWHEYISRCQYMLRQGRFVADLCYLQPEAAPQGFTGHTLNRYEYDNCGAEVVLTRMSVKDGRLLLPDGMSYHLLVLPNTPTMTPKLLVKIKELVEAGATVVGQRPTKSPSLSGYPECDTVVQRLAGELWGNCDGQKVKEHTFGKGRVICGVAPEKVLAQAGVKPDFFSNTSLHYIHRSVGDTELYFVANSEPVNAQTVCSFRVTGKRPELWWPDTGRVEPAPMFRQGDGVTDILLQLDPSGSVFVVFHDDAKTLDPVQEVNHNGISILSMSDLGSKIVIDKAVYGVLDDPQRIRDVRDLVQQMVKRGNRNIQVAHLAESGDPAANSVKTLLVEYHIDNRRGTVSGKDTDTVYLTEDICKITIDKATYGVLSDPKRTRDVRSKIQHIVDGGERCFDVARMAHGDDPAYMVVKTLVIEYTVNNQRRTATGKDADALRLTRPENTERFVAAHAGADGSPRLEIRRPGSYEIKTATGKTMKYDVSEVPAAIEFVGPWELSFPAGGGAPEHVTLDKLISWSKHSEPGVNFYSGSATYRKDFTVAADSIGKSHRLYLDLGNVQVLAAVKLNGKDLGTLWKAPYRVDVSDAVKPGTNILEVRVVNQWPNRMIGDEQLPDDSDRNADGTLKTWPQWLQEGKPSPTGRYTFTSWRLWKKNDPLLESGLLGPVRIETVAVLAIK